MKAEEVAELIIKAIQFGIDKGKREALKDKEKEKKILKKKE
jgi:hypothetical protein